MASARTDTVEFVDRPERLQHAWDELATRSTNIFATWEWHQAWWRHLGWGRPVTVVDRERRALLPLAVAGKGPVAIARCAGFGPADELGPVAGPDDAARAVRVVDAAARALPLVVLDRVRGDAQWLKKVHLPTVRREDWPLVELSKYQGWDDYLASRSANFRQQLRRRRRKAERELGFRPRLATQVTFERDFDTLLALHKLRFGNQSRAFDGSRAAFHREFAKAALERGWLRLWIAESEGRPVAAVYCWRFAGVEFMYQTGRDPAFDRWAVGQVLLAETVRAALEDGAREYRFLLGGESYKYRFATGDPGVVTGFANQSAWMRAAAALCRMGLASRRALVHAARAARERFGAPR